jgi:hypothetical protein
VTPAATTDGLAALGSLASITRCACPEPVYAGQSPSPDLARFLAELNKQTASLPAGSNNNAPEYYDAVAIIDAAIQHAHSTSGPTILKAIESLKNRSFISPHLKYTFSPTQHFGSARTASRYAAWAATDHCTCQ